MEDTDAPHETTRSRRRCRAPHQGCGEAAARSVAPPVPAQHREPRRARAAHRLRHRRWAVGGEGAARRVAVQRLGAGAPVQSRIDWRRDYPESAITRPFPFNAYYPEEAAPDVDEDTYRLVVDGLVENKQPWTLDQLYALPQETQITRLICVEGWSAIGKWTGAPLGEFLRRIGADLTAKYVHFACAEGYSVSIDMPTALHPQTQMTFKFDDEILPTKFGFPMRIRMPTKLGFKNPKHVVGLAVLNNYTGGYWEDRGYNWFSGL